VLWIAGALADGSARTVLWLAALAVDYSAPLVTYWVPGTARLSPDTWVVGSEHFAERFQLFIIIALGETIVVTGATTSQHELTTATIVAFSLAFLSTAALWWLYFNLVAAITERRLAEAVNRTVLARDAYTYLHVVIVAGILLTAVGDELVIAHPTDELPDGELLAVAAGPALYLFSLVLLRLRMSGTLGRRRLVGAIACLAIGAIGTFAPALVVAALLLGVLVAVIVGDQVAAAHRRHRGEPSPLERVEPAPDRG
jgi:low temperature requirement protein LtrA